MRLVIVMLVVLATVSAEELSCNLQAIQKISPREHQTDSKTPKHLHRRSIKSSDQKSNNSKLNWQINFECRNSVLDKNIVENFSCSPEFNKLKFVFIQNRKVSSTFIDLQPSLISFNKFVGLDLRNIKIRAEPGNCEIWIEHSSLIKAFLALFLAWLF